MYRKILVPVDLEMQPMVGHAIKVATDLAKLYHATITLVCVSPSATGPDEPGPDQVRADLAQLAEDLARDCGVAVAAHHMTSPDVTAELDSTLLKAVDAVKADLVVVGSHKPGLTDYISASHAGRLAAHAAVSVFVVR